MSDQSIPLLKRCTKCGNEFPATLEYFPPDKAKKFGLRSSCRFCERKRSNEYKKTHPEKNRASVQRFRERNRALVRERNKQSRKRHWEKFLEWTRDYQKQRREQGRDISQRYRARKRDADGDHDTTDVQAQYKRQKGRCYYCGEKVGKKYHVEHVIPLDRGGSNGTDNIVIACASCNRHKSNKLPHEWPEGGRLC